MVSSTYLKSFMFPLPILVPAWMHPARHFPWHAQHTNRMTASSPVIPVSILNQSVVLYAVLTVASWPAYRFLRRQVRGSGIPISLRAFHSLLWFTVKGFNVVSKTEVDVFLEVSCFLYDPVNVGNLVSGSSAFSKPTWTSGSSWFA